MAALEHIVSRNLQCPVCLERLTDPKQLSCSHTFCKKCLSDMLTCSSHNTPNSLACPICRKPTTVKGGDVVHLNTNFPLKALIDDLRSSQQLCGICDSKSKASHFCRDCGTNMCKTCLENHNKFPLKQRVQSLEDIREGKVVLEMEVYCPEHPPSERRKYVCSDVCITCKKFICMKCRMLNHEKKGHTVQSAEEYNASTKTEVESLQARGKTKAAAIKNHQTCVESQKKRVTDHINGKRAEINKICQESIKKINERKAVLDKQLESQKVKLCKRLDEMKDADKRLVTSVESASVLAGNSLKAPLYGDTIAIRDSLSGELKNVLGRDDPKKQLATDVAEGAEQLMFTPNNQRDQLSIGEVQFVKCELGCNLALSKKDSMNSMAPTPDGTMAIGSRFGGIDVLSAKGQLQQTVLKDVWIRDIGFLSDGRYIVYGSNTIILYTHERERLEASFETLSDDEGGVGNLTVDSNDLIYVSYRKAEKILVFSLAGGKAIKEIPCDGYEPAQITIYNDLLIVTTKKDGTIRIIDKKGNVKHKVDKSGVHAYAAVTQANTILMAWVKHDDGLVSIDEYTNELKHIKTLISNQKIEKTERCWYYLQEFRTGEIAFCTADRLYIFKLTITPPK